VRSASARAAPARATCPHTLHVPAQVGVLRRRVWRAKLPVLPVFACRARPARSLILGKCSEMSPKAAVFFAVLQVALMGVSNAAPATGLQAPLRDDPHAQESLLNNCTREISLQHSYTLGNATAFDLRTSQNVSVMGQVLVLPAGATLAYGFYLGSTANFQTAHTIHGFFGTSWAGMVQNPYFNIVVSGRGPGLAYGLLTRSMPGAPCAKAGFTTDKSFQVVLFDPSPQGDC
jgi:hypothetical protein